MATKQNGSFGFEFAGSPGVLDGLVGIVESSVEDAQRGVRQGVVGSLFDKGLQGVDGLL